MAEKGDDGNPPPIPIPIPIPPPIPPTEEPNGAATADEDEDGMKGEGVEKGDGVVAVKCDGANDAVAEEPNGEGAEKGDGCCTGKAGNVVAREE